MVMYMMQGTVFGAAGQQHKLYTTPRTWHEHIYHKPARGGLTPHFIRDILGASNNNGAVETKANGVVLGVPQPPPPSVSGAHLCCSPYVTVAYDEGPQDLVVRSPPKLVPFAGGAAGEAATRLAAPPQQQPQSRDSRLDSHNRCSSPPINITDDEHSGMQLLINQLPIASFCTLLSRDLTGIAV